MKISLSIALYITLYIYVYFYKYSINNMIFKTYLKKGNNNIILYILHFYKSQDFYVNEFTDLTV